MQIGATWNGALDNNGKKIPRPLNAFMLFANDHRPKLKNLMPNECNKDISVKLGEMWKDLEKTKKDSYFDLSKRVEREHRMKYPEYRYCPGLHARFKRRVYYSEPKRERKYETLKTYGSLRRTLAGMEGSKPPGVGEYIQECPVNYPMSIQQQPVALTTHATVVKQSAHASESLPEIIRSETARKIKPRKEIQRKSIKCAKGDKAQSCENKPPEHQMQTFVREQYEKTIFPFSNYGVSPFKTNLTTSVATVSSSSQVKTTGSSGDDDTSVIITSLKKEVYESESTIGCSHLSNVTQNNQPNAGTYPQLYTYVTQTVEKPVDAGRNGPSPIKHPDVIHPGGDQEMLSISNVGDKGVPVSFPMQPQYILVNPEVASGVSSASQQVVPMPGAYNGSYVYASASDSSVNYHMTPMNPAAVMLPNGEAIKSEPNTNTPVYCVDANSGGYILLPSPNISYGLPNAPQGNINMDTKSPLSEESSVNQEGGYIINSPAIAPDGSYTLVSNEDGYFLLPANDDQIPFCETAKILDSNYGCLDTK